MRKYFSFFRLRFSMGLQYRAAALAGIVTQFAWGFMECFAFRAFYETGSGVFPMEFRAMVSYIWLQQAFLSIFATWIMDNDIFESIQNGGIAYELCRPVALYEMWFAKGCANRLSRAVLRCFPILIVSALLPEPYRLHAPRDLSAFLWFALTLALGFAVTLAFCMLVYLLTFFTISPQGLRIFLTSAIDFFSGAIVPLPFLPGGLRTVIELLPFAGMQNVPLRIYGGDLAGPELARAVSLQIFWLLAMLGLGKWLEDRAVRKTVILGG